MLFFLTSTLTALSLASLVSAHGLVTEVNGANGITTPGFANVATTPSAQGGDWVTMTASKNVPGKFLGLSAAVAEDFPVQATIPAGTTCTGGADGKTCVIRAKNKALAGPFGSCFAVTQDTAGAAAAKRLSTRRIGVHTNWPVRKVNGVTVSWQSFKRAALAKTADLEERSAEDVSA